MRCLLAISIVLCSCSYSSREYVPNFDSMRAAEIGESLRYAAQQRYLDSIQTLSDSLSKKFELRQQDFPFETFYHPNWHGAYGLSEDALTASVDQSGAIKLISSLYGPDACKGHDQLVVEVNGQRYASDSSIYPLDVVSIDNACHDYRIFDDVDDIKIAEAIARDTSGNIIVHAVQNGKIVCTYPLKPRDITGIRESVHLANLIHQIYESEGE